MKPKLFFLILLFLIPFGCKEEKQIEIIPNLEQDYLSENEVDQPAEFKDKRNYTNKSANDVFINAIKSIHNFNTKDSIRYIIKLRLYISENGRIDKIKDLSTLYDRVEYSADGIQNYTMREKMNEALSEKLAELEFDPAMKAGKKVKSWIDVNGFNIVAKPDGNFDIEMPDFLIGLPFGSKDNYLINADVMPEVVGGMVSILKKIVYPELAKRAGIQGKVFVTAFIDENGNVARANIIRGIGAGCDEAALDAVKQTKFSPGIQNGKPVKVQVTIPIVFKLQ